MKKKIIIPIAIAVAACIITFMVISKLYSTNFGSLDKYEGMNKEYKDTIASLDFPEGYQIPSDVYNDGEDGLYQKGCGVRYAIGEYRDSWIREYLKNYETNSKQAEEALKKLDWILEQDKLTESWDISVKDSLREKINKARLGDVSDMQDYYSINCGDLD